MARPRSREAHEAVLAAAQQLFATHGIDGTSMDAITRASGVSKATIYKHWSDKGALALEVVAHLHGRETAPALDDSGDLRADLLAILGTRPSEAAADLRMRMLPHVMAHAARHPEFGKRWRARMFEPARTALVKVLARAVSRGELAADLDLTLAAALLLGPMMYAHATKLTEVTPAETIGGEVVDAFLRAHARQPTRARRGRVRPGLPAVARATIRRTL